MGTTTVIDNTFVGGASPTHFCKECGALWRLWPNGGGWNLRSKECGKCCDNVPMGDQIVAMTHCFENMAVIAIGSPLSGGFFAGEMTIDSERFALVVAPKTEGEKSDLEYKLKSLESADGTDSDDDGVHNTSSINDGNHPATQFCTSLKIGGFNDWYLPSRDELMVLWRNLGPRRKNTPELFREGSSEAFETDWYWSSTEHAHYSDYAWIVGFDYTSDNALVVMADERTLKKLVKKRLQKMIDQSPTLSAIKSSNPDDTTMYSITLGNGFTIDGAWASSEASVSSESYRIVILDEISKYKTRGNIEDAKARTTVFPDTHKIWILSSPGLDTDDPENRDPLTKETEACDVMMEYHAICPDCKTEQVMVFNNFRYPGQTTLDGDIEADPKAIRRNKSAWYECEQCKSRWNDYQRDKAVLAAMKTGWKSTDGCDIEQPRSLYFHFPSWLSPYVSLSDIVADWIEAQGDHEKLRKWSNRHAGVSYRVETAIAPELTALSERAEQYSADVPMNAGLLTAGVDVQLDRLEIEVVAWGVGAESWGVENYILYGDPRLPDVWGQLDSYLMRRWQHESGKTIGIARCFVDSGYCASHVYKFTAPRKSRGVYAIKGASAHDAPEVLGPVRQRIGKIAAETFNLGVNKLKSTMFGYLALEQPGAGYCHIPATYNSEWYAQMQSEQQIAKRVGGKPAQVWEKKKSNLRNEAIDKRVYALAALLSMRIDLKGIVESYKSIEPPQPVRETKEIANPGQHNRRPGWYNNRR